MRLLSGVVAVAVLVSQGVAGPVKTWKDDPAHSSVEFGVTHMVIAEVRGEFKQFEASVTADKPDFSDGVFDATIQTQSVNTDNAMRDNHLRSDDFLNAAKYPTITFKSTKVEKAGTDTYKIYGNLTIRDVTKPVVLDARLNGVITDPMGNMRAGFTASTTIDRFDYGVKWDKALEAGGLVAGKDVKITLNVEFVAPR